MNWKEFIESLPQTDPETGFQFYSPVAKHEIDRFKQTFRHDVPVELADLYSQSNGIHEKWQNIIISNLIWPIEEVLERNAGMRTYADSRDLYMPFENLLFFSDAGNGDLFAYLVVNGAVRKRAVFVWNHENDSRTWVAPSLQRFIEGWLSGKLKV